MGLKLLAMIAAVFSAAIVSDQLTSDPDGATRMIAQIFITAAVFIALGGTR